MRPVAFVAAFAAVLAATPAALAAPKLSCAARGNTIEANDRARVFQRKDKDGFFVSYACLMPRGPAYRLSRHDDFNAGETLERLTLAGRFVGFADTQCGGPAGEYCGSRVEVRDLRDGRLVRSAKSYRARSYSADLSDLALTPGGDVAWISFSEDPDYPSDVREVRAATTRRGSRLLDAGEDVAPRSLALAGRLVYWTRGGTPRSARLR